MGIPSKRIFLSAVTSDFAATRRSLAEGLESRVYSVDWQDNLSQGGGKTLAKLAAVIRNCDAMVHLVGPGCGSNPRSTEVEDLLADPDYRRFPDFFSRVFDRASLDSLSRTQWEGFLALFHRVPCFLFRLVGLEDFETEAAPAQPREPRQRQHQHWQRIKTLGEDRGKFSNDSELIVQVYRALLDDQVLRASAPPPSAGIVWPTADPAFRAELEAWVADREHVVFAFESMMTGQPTNKRLLLIRGDSGSSKSSLLKSLWYYARHLGVRAVRLDLEGQRLEQVLAAVVDGLDLPRPVGGPEPNSVIRALRERSQPGFIAFDTFEKSEPRVTEWIRDALLSELDGLRGLVVAVAGKSVPLPGALDRWRAWVESIELAPLVEVPPWERHFRAQGVDLTDPERVEFLSRTVRMCRGIPSKIDPIIRMAFEVPGREVGR